jgi:hypothetical protein
LRHERVGLLADNFCVFLVKLWISKRFAHCSLKNVDAVLGRPGRQ